MHVVIVGNGIAGVTVARHVRKRDSQARITLISAESEHHWSRPALMYIYMGHMRYEDTKPYESGFWRKNRIDLVQGWVDGIDTAARTLSIDGRRTMHYDKLVLATGSIPNKFGWPGQDLERVSGLYSLNDLAALEAWSPDMKHAAVVGGGLIGIELAEMLHSRGIHVSLIVRESAYWNNVLPTGEAEMVNDVIRAAGIDLQLGTELKEIVDDGTGAVGSIVTSKDETIPVQYVGLTAGVRPNTNIVAGSGIEAGRGILVDRHLQTSAPDVYACGDCAEIKTPEGERNLIQAVWYTGGFQGETVAANLCGDTREYDPGIWFNSAKFFDLEYHVYGEVPSARAESAPDAPESVFWKHPDGHKALRIVHREGTVVGFNTMGLRFRHRVCEQWIAEERGLDYVLTNLRQANFDPEFYRWHGKAIAAAAKGA